MRFLAVYDPHFSSDPPHSRKDDYAESMFQKLAFIRQTAAEHKVAAVIFAGDFSHKKTQPTPYTARMCEELQKFHDQRTPPYAIIGNHDVYAANVEFIDKTFLGILFKSRTLFHLKRAVFQEGTVRVVIDGYDYQPRLVSAPRAMVAVEMADVHIAVAHGFISKKQPQFDTEDVVDVESFVAAGYDVLILGHDHLEYPPRKYDRGEGDSPLLLLRGGALSRGTKHQFNRTRQPGFTLLDIDKEGWVTCHWMPVECLPVESIFLEQQIEREGLEQRVRAFIQALQDRRDLSGDIFSILEEIVDDPEVLAVCFQYLEDFGFVRA